MWAVGVPVEVCLYKREFRILESHQSCVQPSSATSFSFGFLSCKSEDAEAFLPCRVAGKIQ